jgi:large subunit ribosomal protein L11
MIELESHIVNIAIFSKNAESGPPLGTILGNLGLNAVKFCKEFNEFTEDLPEYFYLNTTIFIAVNKNYSFIVKEPSIGYILSLLKYEKEDIEGFSYEVISLEDLVQLAKFKFKGVPLEKSIPIILGTLQSFNLEIDDEVDEIDDEVDEPDDEVDEPDDEVYEPGFNGFAGVDVTAFDGFNDGVEKTDFYAQVDETDDGVYETDFNAGVEVDVTDLNDEVDETDDEVDETDDAL